MRLKIITTVLIIFGSLQIFAQTYSLELISGSGDVFSNSTYQLDWSIGEVVTTTHATDEMIITQGFHQSNLILTKIWEINTDIDISVFPNPTSDFIYLQIDDKSNKKMQYQLFDLSGKLLQIKSISSIKERISFSEYTPGIYFLRILDKNHVFKTFRVQKIN